MSATDSDGDDVRYSLADSRQLFSVGEVDGRVNVIGRVDREERDIYHVNVIATDNGGNYHINE